MTSTSFKRPLGVTIRGLLYLAEGAITILCGVLILITTQHLRVYLDNFASIHGLSIFLKILDSGFSYILITWLILAGIAGIIIGIGILQGKRWAWKITIIQTLFSVSVGVIYFLFPDMTDTYSKIIGVMLELTVGAVIIYYFYRPNVRLYFNRLTP